MENITVLKRNNANIPIGMWEEALIFMLIYLGVFFILPDKIKKKILSNSMLCATIILGFLGGLYGISRYSTSEGFYQSSGSGGCGACESIKCNFTATLSATGALTNINISGRFTIPTVVGADSMVNTNGYKGRYIRIRPSLSLGDGFLNITQVIVNDSAGNNLALNKPVYSTSKHPSFPPATFVTNGTLTPSTTFFHSGTGDRATEFLEIDLGASYAISSIRILGRGDCCAGTGAGIYDRTSQTRIEINADPNSCNLMENIPISIEPSDTNSYKLPGNTTLSSFSGSTGQLAGPASFTAMTGSFIGSTPIYCRINEKRFLTADFDQTVLFDIYGRYVRIYAASTTGDGFFSLSQVVVNDATGTNIALNKTATSTSTKTLAKAQQTMRVITFAGSGGVSGFADGTGAAARFRDPHDIAIDSNGNLFVADLANHRIRKITPAGVVTTFAGSGTPGPANGTGTAAQFSSPIGICIDSSNSIYVADLYNNAIRKITPAGVVTTLSTAFSLPYGCAVDSVGNIYVAATYNHQIKKITPAGVVSVLAGTGATGGADGPGTSATFNYPAGVAVHPTTGDIYVAGCDDSKIRKITPAGVVSTYAGTGTPGTTDGPAATATFNRPFRLIFDPAGNLYVAEQGAGRIRLITNGIVQTYAGTTPGFIDNVTADKAQFKWVTGLALAPGGDIYAADSQNHCIRLIQSSIFGTKPPSSVVDGVMSVRSAPNIFENNNTGRTTDYWQLDLGSLQMITTVRVITRSDVVQTIDRNTGLRVVVLESLTDTPNALGSCAVTPTPIFPGGTTADERAVIGPMILLGYNGQIALNIYRGIESYPASFVTYGLTDSQSAEAVLQIKADNILAERKAGIINDTTYYSEMNAIKGIKTMAGITFNISNEVKKYMDANIKNKYIINTDGTIQSTISDKGKEKTVSKIVSLLKPKVIDPSAGNSQTTRANEDKAIPPPPDTGEWAKAVVAALPQASNTINIPKSGATTTTATMTPTQKWNAVKANNTNAILITPLMTSEEKAAAIAAANSTNNMPMIGSNPPSRQEMDAASSATSAGKGFTQPTLGLAAGGQGQWYMRTVNVPYSQAAEKCTEYNGRLASRSQVQNAASKGASYSSAGWCSDNSTTVAYPRDNVIKSTNATSSSYYVNCFGPKPPQGTADVAPWTDTAKTMADGATYTADDWSQRIYKLSLNPDLVNSGTPLKTQEAYYVGGTQSLTKTQAEEVCKNTEGILASTAQLNNAIAAGANWCGSGWLSDANPRQAGASCTATSVTGATCFGIKPSENIGTNTATIASKPPINLPLTVSGFITSGTRSPSWSQTGASTTNVCKPGTVFKTCILNGANTQVCLKPSDTCATGCANARQLSDGTSTCSSQNRTPVNCPTGSESKNCGTAVDPNYMCIKPGDLCSTVENNPGEDPVRLIVIPDEADKAKFTAIANRWLNHREKYCGEGQDSLGNCLQRRGQDFWYFRSYTTPLEGGEPVPVLEPVGYDSNTNECSINNVETVIAQPTCKAACVWGGKPILQKVNFGYHWGATSYAGAYQNFDCEPGSVSCSNCPGNQVGKRADCPSKKITILTCPLNPTPTYRVDFTSSRKSQALHFMVNAQYIRLTGNGNYIGVSQLVVVDKDGNNIARDTGVTVSSVGGDWAITVPKIVPYAPTIVAYYLSPNTIVDGTYKPRSYPSIWHSASPSSPGSETSYIQINLPSEKFISHIIFHGRDDCCQDRIRGMRIQLFKSCSTDAQCSSICTPEDKGCTKDLKCGGTWCSYP